jgi:hypothetical protein
VSKPQMIMLQVTGQPPLNADPALFSNFVGISRVGAEVQFEFVFVDLSQVATLIQNAELTSSSQTDPIVGKTVAKIVMPASSFSQLKPHVEKLFSDIEKEVEASKHGEPQHVTDDRKRAKN